MDSGIHAFERAGLGKAPFAFVGSYESKYQAIPGDPNCPVQPGASCDFCGQGIVKVCRIRGACGTEFKVGQDCVRKTGDAGLRRVLDAKVAKVRRDKSAAKSVASREALASLLADESVRQRLAAIAHPSEWAAAKGETLLDWAEWMAQRCGHAGRARVIKQLQAVAS